MENQGNDQTANQIDEFSDEFQCCVCLDIYYKPVVLACGHIACFWCVFRSMDKWHGSHCPVCRNPYNHFPSICWLLNFVLLKLYPSAYKRRETQVIEEEKKSERFSPQFDTYLSQSHFSKEIDILGSFSLYSTTISQSRSRLTSSMEEGEPSLVKDSEAFIFADKDSRTSSCETSGNLDPLKENTVLVDKPVLGACEQVHITDLPCPLCKQLLYRPLVLNCGHVYCEACIINLSNTSCKCQVCQCVHPNGFPKVCLVLEHFLAERFPEEYAARRLAVLNQTESQHRSPSICSTQAQKNGDQHPALPTTEYSSWSSGQVLKVHVGFGCDHCGMYPIIGERYNCKDCLVKMGFDLCEGCHNRSPNLPGRFNQQHTPEHKFEIVDPTTRGNLIVRLEEDEYFEDDGEEDDGFDDPEDMDDDDFPLPGASDHDDDDAEMDSESGPPVAPDDDAIENDEAESELTEYYHAEIARLRQEAVEREIRHRQELDAVRAEMAERRRQFINMMRRAGFPIPDDDSPTSST
ncbi:hypothetical protein LguiA_030044 [Lonicera macranthoides]